jgi:hypothetical protein
MAINKGAVNAAGNGVGVLGNQFWVCGIRRVVEGDAVFAIRRAFARYDQNLTVRGRRDIVD